MPHVDAGAIVSARCRQVLLTCQGSIEKGCTLPVVMLLQICLACLHLKSTAYLSTLSETCSILYL